MLWWIWILFGLGLLVVEMLTPGGFFVLFFGTGALIVGLLTLAGLSSPSTQWLLFSVISVGSLLLLRRRLVDRFQSVPDADGHSLSSLLGDTAVLTEDLAHGGVGKAELRGTSWSVRSREARTLPRGERCTVERVDGLTLWVKPEQEKH